MSQFPFLYNEFSSSQIQPPFNLTHNYSNQNQNNIQPQKQLQQWSNEFSLQSKQQQHQQQTFNDVSQQHNWNIGINSGNFNTNTTANNYGILNSNLEQPLLLQQNSGVMNSTSFIDGVTQQIIQAPQTPQIYGFAAKVKRKERVRWSPVLHKCFVQVVDELGGPWQATPKQIVTIMKQKGAMEDLSINHVKSHLQKFRQMLKGGQNKSDGILEDFEDRQMQVSSKENEVSKEINENIQESQMQNSSCSKQDFRKFVDMGRSCQERMKQLKCMYDNWCIEFDKIGQAYQISTSSNEFLLSEQIFIPKSLDSNVAHSTCNDQ